MQKVLEFVVLVCGYIISQVLVQQFFSIRQDFPSFIEWGLFFMWWLIILSCFEDDDQPFNKYIYLVTAGGSLGGLFAIIFGRVWFSPSSTTFGVVLTATVRALMLMSLLFCYISPKTSRRHRFFLWLSRKVGLWEGFCFVTSYVLIAGEIITLDVWLREVLNSGGSRFNYLDVSLVLLGIATGIIVLFFPLEPKKTNTAKAGGSCIKH